MFNSTGCKGSTERKPTIFFQNMRLIQSLQLHAESDWVAFIFFQKYVHFTYNLVTLFKVCLESCTMHIILPFHCL